MNKVKYITSLDNIPQLTDEERATLNPVCDEYAFRTNDYYLSLIDWNDPEDPIRRIVIPHRDELAPWGGLDPSNEKAYTKVPGLEHKYEHTAVLLVNDVCGAYCRFCFRKRIFMHIEDEVTRDIGPGLDYIRNHSEINNVLLTGGDPLLLSTRKLENIISQLSEIKHVRIIRLGSKMPAFNPYRIIDDPSLAQMLSRFSTPGRKIYIMAHFNHPRELTDPAREALHILQRAGVTITNQTPLIRGVNDSPEVLSELFDELSFSGIPPYYVFQCRPTQGNKHLAVPIEEAFEIHEQAKMGGSGLAKRSRLVMSHASGKLEVLSMTDEHIIFRFHRAAKLTDKAYTVVFKRNPQAYWYDDYTEMITDCRLTNPFLERSETVL